MKNFQVPAILDGVSSLRDGGLSIRYHTNELTQEEKVKVMDFLQGFGWLLFSENEQDEDSLILEDIRRDTGGKSPAQRFRAVLYVSYQQSGHTDLTFEQFYAKQMEKHINYEKQNLRD